MAANLKKLLQKSGKSKNLAKILTTSKKLL